MKTKKYILLFVLISLVGTLSITWGLLQSLIIASLLVFFHSLLMTINSKYRTFVEKELGTPIELNFSDKNSFYSEHGVNTNSKFIKFTNSEMFLGLFALLQVLINHSALSFKLSITKSALFCLSAFIIIVLFDFLLSYLGKKSSSYSDFYSKSLVVAIFIAIPIMFFGLLFMGLRML